MGLRGRKERERKSGVLSIMPEKPGDKSVSRCREGMVNRAVERLQEDK